MISSKEAILQNIKKALETPTKKPIPKPDFTSKIYNISTEDKTITFVENFNKVEGQFIFCEDEEDFLYQLKIFLEKKNTQQIFIGEEYLKQLIPLTGITFKTLEEDITPIEIGITLCEALIARTGSILVSSKQLTGRRLTIFPPVHIVVGFTSQLLDDIKDGLQLVKEKYERLPSMISMITGPSRTADIEKTLVLGAHGPKELLLFLIDDIVVEKIN